MIGSVPDWIILAVVVVVLFGGASRIPALAKALGRATGEFKRGQAEIEKEIRQATSPDLAAPGGKDTQATKKESEPSTPEEKKDRGTAQQ
ncbi:MAG: twin-arginine translocase TatA/TatE family subunit [Nitrososphaerota archaeon]|nr:twin-arginine translocase TatA/TatE family subunit [Nitrososphaerota archaeon]MDG6938779.1 twin-arginine translocase TatA/TatE family subunit [Nitrososphaerota archaeon]